MKNSELYMRKKNRDRRARQLKSVGHLVRRTHVRNVYVHPMYVEDYEAATGVHLTAEDKGFGNDLYRTRFSRLYEVRWGRTKEDLYL